MLMHVASFCPASSRRTTVETEVLMNLILLLDRPRAFGSRSGSDTQPAGSAAQRPGEQCCTSVHGADSGRRCAGEAPELHDCADHGLQLNRASLLDILQHGSLVRAHLLGSGYAFVNAHLERYAQLVRDALRFVHDLRGEFTCEGELAYSLERSMGERADRVEAQISPKLKPDLSANVVCDGRFESSFDQAGCNCLHAGCRGSVRLAEAEAVTFDYLHDSGLDQVGSGVDYAADHARGIDVARNAAVGIRGRDPFAFVLAAVLVEIPPRDPVLHRHDRRVF